MKRYILALFMAIICLMICSCQATPKEEAVVPKNQNYESVTTEVDKQKKVESEEPLDGEETSMPWNISTKSNDGKTIINIDTEILSKAMEGYTVYESIPYVFTDADIERYVKSIFPDKVFFDNSLEQTLDKGSIERDIVKMKADINSLKTDGTYSTGQEVSASTIPDLVNHLEQQIDNLQKLYEEAPDKVERVITDFKFVNGQLSIITEEVNPIIISGFLEELDNNCGFMVLDKNASGKSVTERFELVTDAQINQELVSEAQEICETIVGEKLSIQRISKISYTDQDVKKKNEGLEIIFGKVVNGLGVTYVEEAMGILDGVMPDTYDTYIQSKPPENIILSIGNNEEIIQFDYLYPMKTGEVLVENAKLMPVENIKQKAISQMEMKFIEPNIPEGKLFLELNIDRVVLGTMNTRSKGDPTEFLSVPVWDFLGTTNDDFYGDAEISMLTLNALDGSVIDRRLGY